MKQKRAYSDVLRNKYLMSIPLYVILIVYPILYNTDYFLTGITSGFLCTVFLIAGVCVVGLRKNKFVVHEMDLLFGVFVGFYAIRMLLVRTVGYQSVVMSSAVLVGVYLYIRNMDFRGQFFYVLYGAGIIQGIWYVFQTQDILPSYHYLFKGTGCFFNPAILSIFLVISLLAGVYGYRKDLKFYWKLLGGIGLVFLFSCVVVLNSRAAWIALIAGGIWIGMTEGNLFSKVRSRLSRSKHSLFSCLLLIGIGLAIVFLVYGCYNLRRDSVRGRFLIWQVIGGKLSEAPFCGHGPLEAAYMPMQAEWFAGHANSELGNVAGNNVYAFNELLRTAFETGFIGLVLVSILFFTSAYYSFKGNRVSHYAGAIGIAVFCFGQFSYPFSVELITTVAVMALALVSGGDRFKYRLSWKANVYTKSLLFLLALSFLGMASLEYVREKKADVSLMKAQKDTSVLTGGEMIAFYRYLQGNPDFMLCYGKTLYNHQLYKEASEVLERAYLLKPSSELVCDLGKCYQHQKRYKEAEEAYLLASHMVPAYITPVYCLFKLYREAGDPVKAKKKAEYIISMPVKVVNTSVLRIRNQARMFLK